MTSCECVSGRRASSENTSTVLPAPLDPTTRAFLLAPQRVPRTNEFRICVAFASRRHKKFEKAQIGTGRIWGGATTSSHGRSRGCAFWRRPAYPGETYAETHRQVPHRIHRGHYHLVEGHGFEVPERWDLGLPQLPVQLLWVDVVVVHARARRELSLRARVRQASWQESTGKQQALLAFALGENACFRSFLVGKTNRVIINSRKLAVYLLAAIAAVVSQE